MPPESLTLLLMTGLPGSGKSTLALALGRRLGWPVLDKDTVKTALLDLGVAEQPAGQASYVVPLALCHDLLGQGRSVIFDSPAAYPTVIARSQAIAAGTAARLRVVLCTADVAIRRLRVEGRTGKRSQPTTVAAGASGTERPLDQHAGDGRHLLAHLPPDTLVIGTDRPADTLTDEVVAHLRCEADTGTSHTPPS